MIFTLAKIKKEDKNRRKYFVKDLDTFCQITFI